MSTCTGCKAEDVRVFQFSDATLCRACYLAYFGEARSFDVIVGHPFLMRRPHDEEPSCPATK